MSKKFLDNDGLLYLWGKIKALVNTKANASHTHAQSEVTGLETALAGKSDTNHTHKYAGSSSAGGAATSANKLNTDAGSLSQPVYFAGGIPIATRHTLEASVPSDAVFTDTTYSDMGGATSSTAGTRGLVPAPAAGKQTSFLRGDGTWVVPKDTTYDVATAETNGLMSTTDRIRVDSIEYGAEKNDIVTVKRNGTVLTPDDDRAVDITVPTKTSELTNNSGFLTASSSAITAKADKSTTLAGYGIADAYTKTQTDTAIATAKQEAIDTILGENVDADFDTLQEVATWIASDTTNSAALISRVSAIENDYQKASELVAITNAEIDTICV